MSPSPPPPTQNSKASLAEIKSTLTAQIPGITPGGVVLHREGNKTYCYSGEAHTVFIGETGTGKSSSGISPLVWSCIQARESIIMVEPKDEHARHFKQALRDNGYKVAKINFSNPCDPEGINCNPLSYPRHCYLSTDPCLRSSGEEALDSLAAGIWPISFHASDPFWGLEARNMFRAAAQLLFEYAPEEETTFASIHTMYAQDSGLSAAGFRKVVSQLPKNSPIASVAAAYLQAPTVTRGGLQSSFLSRLLPYMQENLLALLGRDELHIYQLQDDGPTAIFIILPDQSDHCDPLAGALVTQLISHYYYLAQSSPEGRLNRRLNVILEELGNIGQAIPQLHKYMSGARSRNIRLHLVLQDRGQLDLVYGSSKAGTILQNAGLVVQFRSNHWQTLQETSQKIGTRHVMICGKGFTLPVISETQLAGLRVGEALVNLQGQLKFVTRLPHISTLMQCESRSEQTAPPRVCLPPPVFDVDALARRMAKEIVLSNRTGQGTKPPAKPKYSRTKKAPPVSAPATAEEIAAEPVRNIPLKPKYSRSTKYDATLIEIREETRAQLTFNLYHLHGLQSDFLIHGMKKLPFRLLSEVPLEQAKAVQATVIQSGGICAITETGDPDAKWLIE